MNNELLIERIIQLRSKNKLSQTDLAKKLNISRQAYNHYERGFRVPSFESLTLLSEIFEVSTDYLLGLTDNPSQKNEDTQKSLTNSEAFETFNKELSKLDINVDDGQELETILNFIKNNESTIKILIEKNKE